MDFSVNAPGLSLLFFLVIGFYSCYTDIKDRKIKNWLLGLGALLVISLNLFFPAISPNRDFFINIVLSVLIALTLWRMNIWAAGDGKFFIFSSIFICFFAAGNILHGLFYGAPVILIVLVNTFISALAYLFLEALAVLFRRFYQRDRRDNLIHLLRASLSRFKDPDFVCLKLKIGFFYLATLIFFAGTGKFANKIVPVNQKNHLFFYLILICVYSLVGRLVRKIRASFLVIGVILMALFFNLDIAGILKNTAGFIICFSVVRIVINSSIRKGQAKIIDIRDLEPNILLTKEEIALLPAGVKANVSFFSDGLNKTDAQRLKAYFKSIGKEKVDVYNTFPFVPFMVAGVLATCWLKGKVMNIWFFI